MSIYIAITASTILAFILIMHPFAVKCAVQEPPQKDRLNRSPGSRFKNGR